PAFRDMLSTGAGRTACGRGALAEKAGDGGPKLRQAGAGARRCGDGAREGRGPLEQRRVGSLDAGGQVGRADLIAFGQDDLVADGRLTERIQNGIVDAFEPVTGIDQDVDTTENGPSLKIIVNEPRPRGHFA